VALVNCTSMVVKRDVRTQPLILPSLQAGVQPEHEECNRLTVSPFGRSRAQAIWETVETDLKTPQPQPEDFGD
jgi:hypothetical protein